MFKKRKAFTLIELLVVIAIIGILAAIALSATQTARKRAADARNKSDAQTIQKAWVTYSSDNNLFWTPTGAAAAQLTFANTNLAGLAGTGGTLQTSGDLRSGFTYATTMTIGFTGAAGGTFASDTIGVGVPLTVKAATGSNGIQDCAAVVDGITVPGAAGCAAPFFVVTQK